jgi:hypothetical protein
MDYLNHMVARLEHEERVRSVRPVPEFGVHLQARQPNRMLRLAKRSLYVLGSKLVSLGEQMQPPRDMPRTSPVLK